MNKVFVSGMIMKKTEMKVDAGENQHLTLHIAIRHKSRQGELKSELYAVNAWNNTAVWAAETLQVGQIVAVQGYLTQKKVPVGNALITMTEVTAEEFLISHVKESGKSNPDAVTAA